MDKEIYGEALMSIIYVSFTQETVESLVLTPLAIFKVEALKVGLGLLIHCAESP